MEGSVGRDCLARKWRAALARTRRGLFYERTIVITAFSIDDFTPRYGGVGKRREVVRATAENLAHLSSPYLEPFLDWMRHWIARGDVCLLSVINGEIAGFIDLMTRAFRDDDGLRIEVGDRECLVRSLQVFPPFRRTAAANALHDVAFACARRQGIARVIGPINENNIPSLKIAKHVGFREVARLRCGRILGRFTFSRVLWSAPDRSSGREISW